MADSRPYVLFFSASLHLIFALYFDVIIFILLGFPMSDSTLR